MLHVEVYSCHHHHQTHFPVSQMAISLQPLLYPKLHKKNNYINSLVNSNSSLLGSMLNRLLLPSSIRHFLSHHPKTASTLKYPFDSTPRSPLLSLLPGRKIQSFKRVLSSMSNEQSTSSSKSQKHTNRLASEHSPYLLQHAHNPVCENSILFDFFLCSLYCR